MAPSVPEAVEELLTGEAVEAHLATCADGRPHAAPVWFRYEDGVVELVTTGRKLANLRENPRVALSIQQGDPRDPDWTVTLLGRASVVEDEAATREATRRINRGTTPPRTPGRRTSSSGSRSARRATAGTEPAKARAGRRY